MKQDRRSFLRSLIGAIASATIPVVRVVAMPIGYMIGKTWFIPAGTHVLKQTLTIPKDVTLIGSAAKTIIK